MKQKNRVKRLKSRQVRYNEILRKDSQLSKEYHKPGSMSSR